LSKAILKAVHKEISLIIGCSITLGSSETGKLHFSLQNQRSEVSLHYIRHNYPFFNKDFLMMFIVEVYFILFLLKLGPVK
jgi:hypothetical protein